MREFLLGRWRTGTEYLLTAEILFREQCTGAAWELAQANTYALWCISYLGDWPEVLRRSSALHEAAREKGDLFTLANLGTFMLPLARLAQDNPDEAREVLRESMAKWSREEYNVQHMTALMGATYVDLYRDDPKSAYERHVSQWRDLKRNNIMHAQICRLLVPELRARSALGMAAKGEKPEPYLREAEQRARRIERENMPYANALAKLLHAGAAVIRGDRERADDLLVKAAEALDGVDMMLFAAVARRRLGELRGGDEGRSLVDAANAWMTGQQISNPTKMANAIAPWLPKSR